MELWVTLSPLGELASGSVWICWDAQAILMEPFYIAYVPSASFILLFLESSVSERHCVGSSPRAGLLLTVAKTQPCFPGSVL